ncbi:MAG: D-aminoacylase [Chloroflexi bacterium]|nr:D-aminoacylase [Chloroflexota bacterium]
MAFETIITGGTIVDGSGKDRYEADIGITDGAIAAIGDLGQAETRRSIDASGHVVSPGFIDMHSHSDRTLIDDRNAESKVFQGVTTEVVGNCSYSPFPVGPLGASVIARSHLSEVEWTWTDHDGYAAFLESDGISVNVANQVGHATLRAAAGLLDNRPPTADELDTMRRLAAESVEQGAFSFTTGLTLPPGSYAATDELIEITRAIAPYEGAFYASHARLWADNHVGAVEEAIEIGAIAGVPVQYSHMAIIDSRVFDTPEVMTEPIVQARARGVDVTYDMYPYIAGGTHLSQMVPEWLQDGGVAKMLERLRTPDTRRQAVTDLRKGWFRGLPWEWDTIIISHVQTEANRDIVGKSIEQIAEDRNHDPAEVYLQLIDEEDNNVGCVAVNRREDNIRYFMAQPYAMFGSDGSAISPTGIYGGDKPHPRFYGCYPRILGRYVREQPAVLTLEEAIHKAAGFPAERMGFKDRGLLKAGYAADIVILDPDTVIDNATFDDPHRYSDGMPHVLVNGEPVVLNGAHTGTRPGRVLRRGG